MLFLLGASKKAHSEKSTQCFSQDIPFSFYDFFSTFQYFFLVLFQETSQILNFFVLFEQIYFVKVNYIFEQLQKLKKKKVKRMSFFLILFFYFFFKKALKCKYIVFLMKLSCE